MNITDTVTLNNGIQMPWLGFGVFQMDGGSEVEQAVSKALEVGSLLDVDYILCGAVLRGKMEGPSNKILQTYKKVKNKNGKFKKIKSHFLSWEEISASSKIYIKIFVFLWICSCSDGQNGEKRASI